MTSRLIELRSAIIADLKVFLPEIKTIEPHMGPFDLDELKAFTVRAPAIKVSLLGWRPSTDTATRELAVEAHLAAYIVTRPSGSISADTVAIGIAEALAGRLVKKSFTAHSEWATAIGCTNHYSGAARETGPIALFSVDWKTTVQIGTDATARYVTAGAGAIDEVLLALNGGDPVSITTPVE